MTEEEKGPPKGIDSEKPRAPEVPGPVLEAIGRLPEEQRQRLTRLCAEKLAEDPGNVRYLPALVADFGRTPERIRFPSAVYRAGGENWARVMEKATRGPVQNGRAERRVGHSAEMQAELSPTYS
jgi:hypothetical protein